MCPKKTDKKKKEDEKPASKRKKPDNEKPTIKQKEEKKTTKKREEKAQKKGKEIESDKKNKKKKLDKEENESKKEKNTKSKTKEVSKKEEEKDLKKEVQSKKKSKKEDLPNPPSEKKDSSNQNPKKDKQEKIVTVLKKGKAPVDPRVPNGKNYEVVEYNSKIYHAALMWTDLKHNNNKYYIIQLLKSEISPNSYMVFNRWGRVGTDGQIAMFNYSNIETAISEYNKKYVSKTSKGYTEILIDFEESKETQHKDNPPPDDKEPKNNDKKESNLNKSVQDLIRLIFNMNMMQKAMEEIGYDAKKMPLGKLSKETIKKGYEALKKIADVLEKKASGDLADLSGEFYTLIPHDFGFKKMSQFVINTQDKLKAKLEMLDSLKDIEIAHRLLDQAQSSDKPEIDANYDKLKCNINPIELNSEEFKLIEKFIKNTHGKTHYFSLDILDAFKIERNSEKERFNKAIGNNHLLFHGSRLTNFAGILSQGLRIAPPEAPVSGYMF